MALSFSTKRDPNAGLLPPGVYRFVVEKAIERTGDAGPYAALRLRPIVKGEKWGNCAFDNLSSSKASRFRVDAFMDAVGAADEPGEVGLNWFIGKSGWAEFKIETGTDGKDRPKVVDYLTAEKAEKRIAALAEQNGMDDDAMTVSTHRSSRPIPDDDEDEAPVQKKGRRKAQVAELEADPDDDVPF